MAMTFKERLHEIIFEADTPAGRAFDLTILALIILSIVAVSLESVSWIGSVYRTQLRAVEWFCTIVFTIEYCLRLYCVRHPFRYARSFFGIIDLVAILPAYLFLIAPGLHELIVIRVLRLLRIFRILKLARYVGESHTLMVAILAARRKIGIFLFAVFNLVIIIGTIMYVVEGPAHGFHDIPTGMYWAIVTLTTVGFGDLTPATPLGRFFASIIMIMGYGIIAVPTGIMSVELSRATFNVNTQACTGCGLHFVTPDAKFCSSCGSPATPT